MNSMNGDYSLASAYNAAQPDDFTTPPPGYSYEAATIYIVEDPVEVTDDDAYTPQAPFAANPTPPAAVVPRISMTHYQEHVNPMGVPLRHEGYWADTAPQAQTPPTRGNSWPTALGSGTRRRTCAHYTTQELASSLPDAAVASPSVCATTTQQHAAPYAIPIPANLSGGAGAGDGYAVQRDLVAPQPRYATGFAQHTHSAPSPYHPAGGDVHQCGPLSAPAQLVWGAELGTWQPHVAPAAQQEQHPQQPHVGPPHATQPVPIRYGGVAFGTQGAPLLTGHFVLTTQGGQPLVGPEYQGMEMDQDETMGSWGGW